MGQWPDTVKNIQHQTKDGGGENVQRHKISFDVLKLDQEAQPEESMCKRYAFCCRILLFVKYILCIINDTMAEGWSIIEQREMILFLRVEPAQVTGFLVS